MMKEATMEPEELRDILDRLGTQIGLSRLLDVPGSRPTPFEPNFEVEVAGGRARVAKGSASQHLVGERPIFPCRQEK
jgi:hypothetical protein